MGEKTGIGWTGATWNPWVGCDKISPGCDNCYMFKDMARFGKDPDTVTRTKKAFTSPLGWKDPRLIFTCSWGDWFHVDADPWREEAWDIIRRTPHHTYQILTKRHGRIAKNLPHDWPLKNVWLGVSAENDEWFHRRAEMLRNVPGDFIRFISAEPLIGPIETSAEQLRDYKVDWMIVGGESKAGCRPMNIQWARNLQYWCEKAGTAFFLKQLGGHPDKRADEEAILDGKTYTEMPVDLTQQQLTLL